MRFCFSISNHGLGHATRTIVLIRAILKEGHEAHVLSTGNALTMLREELGRAVTFKDEPAYPLHWTKDGFSLWGTLSRAPQFMAAMRAERAFFRKYHQEHAFDRIIADGKFGCTIPGIRSYYINNQLRMYPDPVRGPLSEMVHTDLSKRFTGILVPDGKGTLGGSLTYPHKEDARRIHYLGILSSVRQLKVKADVDYFISISGPGETRERFKERIMASLEQLKGKIVVALGDPDHPGTSTFKGATVHGYLNRKAQETMLNRAKFVISRSGYTTLMELAELGKPAFFVPVPGQAEQEYLMRYHRERGDFYGKLQHEFDLGRDIPTALKYPGLKGVEKTKKSVERFLEIVS